MYIGTPGTRELPLKMMYSLPPHSAICCFYTLWFDHLYHSAILLMSESVVHSYDYDRGGYQLCRVILHD